MCRSKVVSFNSANAVLGALVLAAVFSSAASASAYRSFDGSGNNQTHNGWGAADTQLLRLAPSEYADSVSALAGVNRPNPRTISNVVVAQADSILNSLGATDMLMQWGQFLDHDIDLTRAGSTESKPIEVPTGDLVFNNEIPFHRSVFDPTSGSDAGNPRQQTNAVTAYIDASQIYGSDQATADSLRIENSDGSLSWQLKMTSTVNGDLLHLDDNPVDTERQFNSGDERANEQIGLTVMHTLFNREHNRLGAEIAAANPGYDDEKVYQETRKLVGAMMQTVTFNEFLPTLLGDGAIDPYAGYRDDVNPGIANAFSTAAYRFGHSTLSDNILRLDADGDPIAAGHIPLKNAFFNPMLLRDDANGGIEPILRGLTTQVGQKVDPFLVDAVRNFLFAPPVDVGFDLAALNLQRGRDHGLPGYNAMRAALGLGAYTWDNAVFLPGVKDLLMLVYTDIDDVDLWVGGLSEAHVNGGMLGELFSAIVSDQFRRLRDGDRFWYENGMFEDEWMDFLNGSTLSDIIMRNTDIDFMQANVFRVPEPEILALWLVGLLGLRRLRRA